MQVLERASDVIHIDVIDADPKGYALRFSPYDCKTFPNMEQLMQFIECFTQQMVLLFDWKHIKSINRSFFIHRKF